MTHEDEIIWVTRHIPEPCVCLCGVCLSEHHVDVSVCLCACCQTALSGPVCLTLHSYGPDVLDHSMEGGRIPTHRVWVYSWSNEMCAIDGDTHIKVRCWETGTLGEKKWCNAIYKNGRCNYLLLFSFLNISINDISKMCAYGQFTKNRIKCSIYI